MIQKFKNIIILSCIFIFSIPFVYSEVVNVRGGEIDPWFNAKGAKLSGNNTFTGINIFQANTILYNATVYNYTSIAVINSSDFWDDLDTPADISLSQLVNDIGFITGSNVSSYEADTLDSVTNRGSVTNNNITIGGFNINNYTVNVLGGDFIISTTDNNFTHVFSSDGNVEIEGNITINGDYICDSTDCYLISDLNITGTGGSGSGQDNDTYIIYFDQSIYKNVIFNLSKSEYDNYEMVIHPGEHYVYGAELI